MSRYYEHEIREDRPRSPSHHRRDDLPPVAREYSPEYYSGGGAGPIQVVYPDRGPVPIASGPYISGAIPVDAPPPPVHPYYPPDPIGKARHAVDHTFTQSSSGIGVGLLGAVVGGLAAREVSDATVRSRTRKEMENGTYRPRSPREAEKARVISTVVGALVGGLGANAIERRFEVARERDREQQLAWERKWGRGRDHDVDHGRGRLRNRHRDEWNDGYPDYGYQDRRGGRLRSEERYSYRN
ncbi:uncharacterized protein N0V96_006820 [Colletotrichum fioriniae]|uniref:uncharacterized protein n=1 Tax=Colletotrichum fioriniae TaxID=710243 RepID=UPI0032DB520D|nr:hypothetical protein N0V96_006820 [Colletotrichum fioriniae]